MNYPPLAHPYNQYEVTDMMNQRQFSSDHIIIEIMTEEREHSSIPEAKI